jgi:hypothetical protein
MALVPRATLCPARRMKPWTFLRVRLCVCPCFDVGDVGTEEIT